MSAQQGFAKCGMRVNGYGNRMPETLSEQNAGRADYDDYTRAKSAFFDEVYPVFSTWAQKRRCSMEVEERP